MFGGQSARRWLTNSASPTDRAPKQTPISAFCYNFSLVTNDGTDAPMVRHRERGARRAGLHAAR